MGKVSTVLLLVWLAGCQSLTASKVSVDYYQISGNSTAALDKEIRRKGPRIGSDGHAVAVARIKMFPQLRFANDRTGCRIKHAKINVNAKVTLPQWKGRARATAEMGKAWDNIDRYTRLHESVHVALAFQFAGMIEKELLKIPTQKTCAQTRQRASEITNRMLKEHDGAQRKFDADEKARIAKYSRKQA